MNFELEIPLRSFINLSENEVYIVRDVEISDDSFEGAKGSNT